MLKVKTNLPNHPFLMILMDIFFHVIALYSFCLLIDLIDFVTCWDPVQSFTTGDDIFRLNMPDFDEEDNNLPARYLHCHIDGTSTPIGACQRQGAHKEVTYTPNNEHFVNSILGRLLSLRSKPSAVYLSTISSPPKRVFISRRLSFASLPTGWVLWTEIHRYRSVMEMGQGTGRGIRLNGTEDGYHFSPT